jgi:hypothetical protein
VSSMYGGSGGSSGKGPDNVGLAFAIFLGVFFAIIMSDIIKWTAGKYMMQKELEGWSATYKKEIDKIVDESMPVFADKPKERRQRICKSTNEHIQGRSMRDCQNELGETISDLHIRCVQGYSIRKEICN